MVPTKIEAQWIPKQLGYNEYVFIASSESRFYFFTAENAELHREINMSKVFYPLPKLRRNVSFQKEIAQ